MSQKGYIDEAWTDLPLPDGDMAWQKMELLLDGDKRRRRVVPFWLWGIVVGGLAVGSLWLLSKDEAVTTSSHTKEVVEAKAPVRIERKEVETKTANQGRTSPLQTSTGQTSVSKTAIVLESGSTQVTASTFKRGSTSAKQHLVDKTKAKISLTDKWSPQKAHAATFRLTRLTAAAQSLSRLSGSDSALVTVYETSADRQTAIGNSLQSNNSPITKTNQTTDSTKKTDTAAVEKPSPKKPSNKLVWSAGIGLQQAIAVAGQSSSSYNYNGRSASLTDRIPSVYFRLEKGRWAVQAEALYAAPQPVRSFYFSQQTRYDAGNTSLQTERFAIQKLYYHQLPVSINYHLLPNLSVGMGGSYNILAGAVTEQEVTTKNASTGAESTTAQLAPVKGFKDSFLYKTTAGVLLQTDYHLKRLSLGLRYTQNLQPFIKYTRPDGTLMDEKTGVLQAVLRFRLWQSK